MGQSLVLQTWPALEWVELWFIRIIFLTHILVREPSRHNLIIKIRKYSVVCAGIIKIGEDERIKMVILKEPHLI